MFASAPKILFLLLLAMLLAGPSFSPAPSALAAQPASSAAKAKSTSKPAAASASKAAALQALDGVWKADMEATAKGFQTFPTELKKSLADMTVRINAAKGNMQLKWSDGKTQNRSLKLVAQKGSRYTLKVNGENDLVVDAGRPDTLIFIEEQNSIVFRKVVEEKKPVTEKK